MRTVEELIAEVESLPVELRLRVVEALLSSLNRPDPDVQAAWAEEAERRAQAVREGRAKTISGDDFLESLQRRFPSPRCPDPDVTALWVAESRRRLEEIRSGEVETIPGEVVFEKLRQRYDTP